MRQINQNLHSHRRNKKFCCLESDLINATLGWKKNSISIFARPHVINWGWGGDTGNISKGNIEEKEDH